MIGSLCLAQLPAPSPWQWLWIGGLALLLGSAALVARRRRAPEGSLTRRLENEAREARDQLSEIEQDMARLLGELDSLSRRLHEQLDGKYAEVQQAIREADHRISALRILISASRPGETGYAAQSPSAARETSMPDDARTRRIYELADQGLLPAEIARRLEEAAGEVELILNLRSAAQRSAAARNS